MPSSAHSLSQQSQDTLYVLGLKELRTMVGGQQRHTPHHSSSEESNSTASQEGKSRLRKLTLSCSLNRAMTFYDSNLLVVVLQPGLAQHSPSVILKNTKSYPLSSL